MLQPIVCESLAIGWDAEPVKPIVLDASDATTRNRRSFSRGSRILPFNPYHYHYRTKALNSDENSQYDTCHISAEVWVPVTEALPLMRAND